MLATLNDYISFILLLFIVLSSFRIFFGVIVSDPETIKQTESVFYRYDENEDE